MPTTQLTTTGQAVQLVDVVTGSTATLTPRAAGWRVRQSGPQRLWDRIEAVLGAYEDAGRPGPGSFRLTIDATGQHLGHPDCPT